MDKMTEYNLLKDVKESFEGYVKIVNEFIKMRALDRLPFAALKSFGAVLNGYLKIIDEDKSKEIVEALKVPLYGIRDRYHDKTIQMGAIKEIEQIINSYLHDLEKELHIEPEKEEKVDVKKESNLLKDAVEKVLDKYEKDKKQAKQNEEKKFLDDIFGKINNLNK